MSTYYWGKPVFKLHIPMTKRRKAPAVGMVIVAVDKRRKIITVRSAP